MKERELDEFLGEIVRVVDSENKVSIGTLFKITNYQCNDALGIQHQKKNGYFIKYLFNHHVGQQCSQNRNLLRIGNWIEGIEFSRSNVKKIKIWEGERE